jgi:zinc transport system substrate-binding protein
MMGSKLRPGLGRVAWIAAGCIQILACSSAPEKSNRPLVAVSVPPQAFIVRKLAGTLVDVEILVPPGANDETYEPAIDRIQAISEARLYVKVGHPSFSIERAWIDRLLSERASLEVIDGSAGAEVLDQDPHVWVSPSHVRATARNVAAGLERLLPESRTAVAENLRKLETEIDGVDADLRSLFAAAHGRRFFVFHPGWGYLAREYGLEQVAIERHGKEPDAGALAETIADAKSAGVRTIFVQPGFPRASAQVVANEVGAELAVIDPLAYEWSENLRSVARQIAGAAVP